MRTQGPSGLPESSYSITAGRDSQLHQEGIVVIIEVKDVKAIYENQCERGRSDQSRLLFWVGDCHFRTDLAIPSSQASPLQRRMFHSDATRKSGNRCSAV